MRTRIFVIILSVFAGSLAFAQTPIKGKSESQESFNEKYWQTVADEKRLSGSERVEFMELQKRLFEESKHEHRIFADSELVWVTVEDGRLGSANTLTAHCVNADFELGNFTGWVRKTGFHPLYNATGCCPNNNGNQAIMSGAGTDLYGGFPVVAPGGNFSARIGNNAVNGVADRLEYTFSVTPQNVNFSYRYAVVLNDQGHPVSQQPAFTIEMLDSTGFQVPCTFYTVAAASNISGFLTSSVTGGSPLAPVVYKPWTTVALDLTPSLGQVLTLRFTTYDCSQGGHFGYAYVDATCGSFETNNSSTVCPGVAADMCAPPGFESYLWTGPNSFTSNAQCISQTTPGLYSCQTLLSVGCPGPTFNHTLVNYVKPAVSFTPVTTGACALQYTFNSTSSISVGSIASYTWNLGDGNGTFLQSPGHSYPSFGTYTVQFKAISDMGCADSVAQNITIYPLPNISFSPPSNCVNTLVQFTNTSTIPPGNTIVSYTWNLGNGVTSNQVNPTNTYTSQGPFTITLGATSDQGCSSSATNTLGIYPPPVVTFSADNVCFGDNTQFTNTTTIPSGTLVAFDWDFGDGTVSTNPNPVHTFTAPGPYVISFSATSNHYCVTSDIKTITIHPLPVPGFISSSVCLNTATSFTNNSSIPFPYTIPSYSWNFGNGATSTATNPVFTYSTAGTHPGTLTAVSNMGCISSTVTNITVYPLPNISFSPPSACVNTAIQFTNTSQVAAPSSIASFSWNFGNGITTNSANPIYSYTTPATYTIVLQAITNHNCSAIATTSLDIYPEPVASFSVSNHCFGSTTTFTNTSSIQNPDNIPFYNWNFGNGQTSSQINPSVTYTGSGTYTIDLLATSNHGCTNSTSRTVTIHPLPMIGLTSTSVCPGVANSFNASFSITPGSVTSYTWSFGDGSQIANVINPNHAYVSSGNYTTVLTAISDQNCVNSNTMLTVVYPSPNITFSPPGACVGTAISFTNTSTIAYGSINSYTWNFGNGNISNSVNPTYSYPASGNYVVILGATSNFGCVTTNTVSLPIYPAATVDFTASSLCHGNTAAFTNTQSVSSGSVSFWDWDFGNGYFATGQNPGHPYANPGTYTVSLTVTTNSGCTSSISKPVTIQPRPTVAISGTNVCLGNQTTFTNNTTIAGAPLNFINQWLWEFGDNTTHTIQVPAHTYSTHGTYVVTLTAISNQQCSSTGTTLVTTHPLPNISFSPPSACVNTAIQFTNNTSIPVGSIAGYTWHLGSNVTSNDFQPVHTYNTHSNNIVVLTAQSDMGCVQSGTNSLDIYPYPQVTVTPVSNDCINKAALFQANVIYSGFSNSSVNSFTWNFGNSTFSVINSSSSPTTTSTYTSYGTFTVVLQVNTTANCKSIDSTLITIYPNPAPVFTVQNFCHGDSTAFVNLSSIPLGTLSSHNWFFNDGIATSTEFEPKHVFSSPNTYTVVLTEYSTPELNVTCSQSVANVITINPLPQPSFNFTNTCSGQLMHFTNTSPTNSIVNWSWDFNQDGAADASSQHASNLFASPGVHTVSLNARNSFSCVAGVTKTVQVYSNPTASFSANSVCFKTKTSFTNHSVAGDGSLKSFKWNFAGQDSSNLGAPQYSFTAPGIHTVELTVVSGVQSDLDCKAKFTKTVVVHHLPVAQFTAPSVCEGNSTTFQNLSYIIDGSNLRYRWDYMNDGWDDSSSTNAITPFLYPGNGGYTFRLEAISDKGCVDSKTDLIIVHDNPTADFATTKMCVGDKIIFTDLSSSSDGTISTYVWDLNGDNIPDRNEQHPSYTYTVNGEYAANLTVYTQHGCSNMKTRTLYANPKAVAAYRYDKTSGCPPLVVNFENLSTISTGTFSTTWNFGDLTPESRSNNPTHVFTSSGSYNLKLELVSDSGCRTVMEHPTFLTVHDVPKAGFTIFPDEVEEDEPTITVTSGAEGASQTRYFINDGSNFSTENFNHNLKNVDGKSKPLIVQIVQNEFGCSDTTYKLVKIKPAFAIYVPNAFTPNGDGINDEFQAKGVGIVKFSMQIYDRWGHLVFTSDDILKSWDGRTNNSTEPIKMDVYNWKAQVTDVHNKKHNLIGRVTLVQ